MVGSRQGFRYFFFLTDSPFGNCKLTSLTSVNQNSITRGKYFFELVYATTVQKIPMQRIQKKYFELFSRGFILSRELLYTALIRQVDKIIFLHQGEFRNLLRFGDTKLPQPAVALQIFFISPKKNKYHDARYNNNSKKR